MDQGSDPNDSGDGGNEPEPGEKFTIKLGIGDQSGSESEDYVLNCFKIDRETGQEKRIYTLRSGGFGEYKEEDSDVFQQGESYTFQIKWQGSKLTSLPASPGVSSEGPDFDYTFKVEPQGGSTDGILIDSWNSQTGKADTANPLLAVDASDVAQEAAGFRDKYEKKRVVLLAAQTVVGEPGADSEAPGDWLVAEAYSKPSVEMTITSTQLVGSNLEVTLQGTVTDPISRFASGGAERPQKLKFLQDGQVLKSISIGSSVGNGFSFTETVVIPDAKPVSYLIRAETTANVSGLTGFDQSTVSLTWHEDQAAYPVLSAPLSIYFPAAPTAGAVDQATVYVGSGTPPSGAGTVMETAADSGSYAGQLVIPATPSSLSAACEFQFAVPRTFSTTTADSIVLDFRYSAPGFPTNPLYGRWLETGPDTRIFRPYGWFFGNRTLQVAYTGNLPGTTTGSIEPVTLRLPALPGQRSDGGSFKILSGETTYSLIKIDGSWYPKDPVKPGSAKLFLPSSLPVPSRLSASGYDSSEGKLSFKLRLDSENDVEAPEIYVLPGVPDAALGGAGSVLLSGAPAPLAGNEPWAPGQAVQLHQLITAYRLLNAGDDFAMELLDGYLRGGHLIELHDGEDLDLDVALNDLFTDADNIWTIQIEEDWNPVYCAKLLFEGLKQASCHSEVYNHYQFEDPFDDITAFKTAMDVAVQQTRENSVFATQLYLSGFGIINEGADWILVFNDVSEGHYESLAGALPFVPAGLLRGGSHLICRKATGEVLDTLDEAAVLALKDLARNGDFDAAGTLYDNYGFSEHLRKALSSEAGAVKAPTRRATLRDRLDRVLPKPGMMYEAHHDFPWQLKEWFAEHGIDVNDAAFGRWAHKDDHAIWHQGVDGGAYNDWWKAVRDAERQSSEQLTKAQILLKLGEARQQFPNTK